MEPLQHDALYKILFLISTAGKKHKALPARHEIAPGFRMHDLQPVTKKDLVEAKNLVNPKFSGIFSKLRDGYQTYSITDTPDLKQLLTKEVGSWTANLPAWWPHKYEQGFFLRVVSAQSAPIFYPCKTVFKKIAQALQDADFNILYPIQLDDQRQLSFISLLCYMDIPPQIIAGLIANEENEKNRQQAAHEILSFLPTMRLYGMKHAEKDAVNFFMSNDVWLQALIEATGVILLYQSMHDDLFIGQKHVATIEKPLKIFAGALLQKDEQQAIKPLLALVRAHQSLPRQCRKKIYLEPLGLIKKDFLKLLKAKELTPHIRWCLEYLSFDKADESEVAFVFPENVVNTLLSQIKNNNLWYFQRMNHELHDWARPIFSYVLVKQLLELPIILRHLVSCLEKTDPSGRASQTALNSLASSLQIEKEVKSKWTARAKFDDPGKTLPFAELMAKPLSPNNLSELLCNGYDSLRDHQPLSILWVVWLEVQLTQEQMMRDLRTLNRPDITHWFTQRLLFIANPDHSELIDDFTAAQLFVSPILMTAIAEGNEENVSMLLKRILSALPRESAHCIPELIRFCNTFSMAELLLKLAFPGLTGEAYACYALINALKFERAQLIDDYLRKYPEEVREQHYQNKNEFIMPLTDLLLRLAGHIDNTITFKLPRAYKKLAQAIQGAPGPDSEDPHNLLKSMATISSGAGQAIQPLFQKCLLMIAAKMKLLSPEQQARFDVSAQAYKYENLLTVILAFVEVPDLALGRALQPILFEIFQPLNSSKQYTQFLKFIVRIINSIPFSFNARQNTRAVMLEKNFGLAVLLTGFLFYQMYQLRLSSDKSIIESISNSELRSAFLTAHLARLIYRGEHTIVEALQSHFDSEVDYTLTCLQSYSKPAEHEKIAFFLSRPCPLAITIGTMQFPISIADLLSANLAVTCEIPPEDPRHNTPEIRQHMSTAVRDMLDQSINSVINAKAEIPTNLMYLLFARGSILSIRNAIPYIDFDKQDGVKTEALDHALIRFSFPHSPEDKILAADMVKMMLEFGVSSEWVTEIKSGNKNTGILRNGLITTIYKNDPELFGLLCDYFEKQQEIIATNEKIPEFTQAESVQPEKPSSELISWVSVALKECGEDNKKISLNHMVTLVQKYGYTNEQAIKKFVTGYGTKYNVQEVQQRASLSEQPLEPIELIGSSYFRGRANIESDQNFYRIRNTSVKSFLYFNPCEIQKLESLELFKSVYQKPQIVGKYGSGLKLIAGLAVEVELQTFDLCYELKVHGSKERILCYVLKGDSRDDPIIYVACYYLKEGFHGRLNPADLKVKVSYPNFCQERAAVNSEAVVASSISKGSFWGKRFSEAETDDKTVFSCPEENQEDEISNSSIKKILASYRLEKESETPSLEKSFRRAASKGDLENIKLMLTQQLDINAQDDNFKNRKTALHWAVIRKHGPVIEYLLKKGAQCDIVDGDSKTALDYADETIKKLFKGKESVQNIRPTSPK